MPVSDNQFPTDEQRAVLESTARITVVKAGPGSGKTRVFVEALRRRIEARVPSSRAGIAALSFTRVAQQEIAKRIGSQLPAPHFIGTLDSFLLRFVVRPFAHLVGLKESGLRLIPAPFDKNVDFPVIQIGATAASKASIFSLNFCGGVELQPEIEARDGYGKPVMLDGWKRERALELKSQEWRGRGWITHSDCHYLAALILRDPLIGDRVATIVACRFPDILIDELQDTGWFLGRAVTKVLNVPGVRSLVVGDPDQAIYEFSGANPTIFDDIAGLDGARTFSLTVSHRCPERVSAVSTGLSASGARVNTHPHGSAGKTIISRHTLESPILNGGIKRQILDHCEPGDTLAILARSGKTLKRLMGHVEYDTPERFPVLARQLYRASTLIKSGESRAAVGIIEACIGGFAWNQRVVGSDFLMERGVSRKTWRMAVFALLKEVATENDGESWNAWMARAKQVLLQALRSLDWQGVERDLNLKFKNYPPGDGIKVLLTPAPVLRDWHTVPHFSTVHQVKGEEYDCVVLFVPKPHAKHHPCPSIEWWSHNSEEEKRIAFVAASRAKKTFLLIVHDRTYSALSQNRADFFALFETATARAAPTAAPVAAIVE